MNSKHNCKHNLITIFQIDNLYLGNKEHDLKICSNCRKLKYKQKVPNEQILEIIQTIKNKLKKGEARYQLLKLEKNYQEGEILLGFDEWGFQFHISEQDFNVILEKCDTYKQQFTDETYKW